MILLLRYYYFIGPLEKNSPTVCEAYQKILQYLPSHIVTPVIITAYSILPLIITGEPYQVLNDKMLLNDGVQRLFAMGGISHSIKEDLNHETTGEILVSGLKNSGIFSLFSAVGFWVMMQSCLNLNHVTSPPILSVDPVIH